MIRHQTGCVTKWALVVASLSQPQIRELSCSPVCTVTVCLSVRPPASPTSHPPSQWIVDLVKWPRADDPEAPGSRRSAPPRDGDASGRPGRAGRCGRECFSAAAAEL